MSRLSADVAGDVWALWLIFTTSAFIAGFLVAWLRFTGTFRRTYLRWRDRLCGWYDERINKLEPFVTAYWREHYVDQHCTLCGNSGIIDTTETAVTAAGIRVGRKNFCVCPNGQSMRAHGAALGKMLKIGAWR